MEQQRSSRPGGVIDLRSDTVTQPTAEMRKAIAAAEVGDDVFGDDPTVRALQQRVAELLGKEKALFVPSGTMSNSIALKILTRAGDEAIVESGCHHFNFESGSSAFLSGVQLHPIQGERGVITARQVKRAIRAPDHHFPRSRVVCLENSCNLAGGTVFPLDEMEKIAALCAERDLRVHLDGARLWNASIATGISMDRYAACADTVSVCLSKGLGAPVGSVLAGRADLLDEAHRIRKVLGGGMRQAGILAAAGLYGIDHHWSRMNHDHENAYWLAEKLAGLEGISIDLEAVQTNIVVGTINREGWSNERVVREMKNRGVLITHFGENSIRAVSHLQVDRSDMETAARVFREVLA